MTQCVDKYEVRNFIHEKGMDFLLNDLIGVWEKVSDIPFETLPQRFVFKATHGSGWNIVCKDKDKLDIATAKVNLTRWLHDNFFYHGYEWVYKNIKPRIICEKYIEPEDGMDLKDYKIFCFDGVPQMLFVASGRSQGQTHFDFYTPDWKWLPVKQHYPNAGDILPKPDFLPDILEIARKLSEGFPHVRVDLYVEKGRIYFGELTFGHFGGLHRFEPQEYDRLFGEYFILPEKVT